MMKYLKILLIICAGMPCRAQVGFIFTIAGQANCTDIGDDGPAINAKLQAPARICSDRLGNIFIADAANVRIREISAATKRITTVAGSGSFGNDGDNGPATNATFNAPQAVTIDSAGNLYICDGLNHNVRKVTASTGIISLVAGTGIMGGYGDGHLAIDAELNQPAGICIDKSGNILIADWGNDRIRKVDVSTGKISTIAGTGVGGYSGDGLPATNAQLDGPLQVMVDNNGDVLIADQYNSCVRKVSASGIISTIAGIGLQQGYSGDGGPAIHAKLNQPSGLFVDNANNIYIAEYGNGTIRKIDASTGKIYTIAGTGITGFAGDGEAAVNAQLFCTDMVVDAYGNLIIDDYENNRIRKVNGALKVTNLNVDALLLLYPNPTQGKFTIQTPGNESIITIVDATGKVVYQETSLSSKVEVDISDKPSSTYLVYVQSGDEKYASKVLLSK